MTEPDPLREPAVRHHKEFEATWLPDPVDNVVDGILPTRHLPAEIVRRQVVVGVWQSTAPGEDRYGCFSVGVSVDGEAFPADPPPGLAEYVQALLDRAADRWRERYELGRAGGAGS